MNKKYSRDEEHFIIGSGYMRDRDAWEDFKKTFKREVPFSSYVKKRQRLKVRKPPGRPKRRGEEE